MKRYIKRTDVYEKIQREMDRSHKEHQQRIEMWVGVKAQFEEHFPSGEFLDVDEVEEQINCPRRII